MHPSSSRISEQAIGLQEWMEPFSCSFSIRAYEESNTHNRIPPSWHNEGERLAEAELCLDVPREGVFSVFVLLSHRQLAGAKLQGWKKNIFYPNTHLRYPGTHAIFLVCP